MESALDMSFASNKKAFLNPATPSSLFRTYCILVAIELALKDANVLVLNGGHDVPTMLQQAATAALAPPSITAQLNSLLAKLRVDLNSITCQGRNGQPTAVPSHSYPYLRYTRQIGDWGGVSETPANLIQALEATCNSLRIFLNTHSATLGVQL